MKLDNLRFRQVHLDFHTSEQIDKIGEKFDKTIWQQRLKDAAIDSITCFSSCHHGYSYHPTVIGQMHPHLKYNLLRAQIDACKEIDINVPVYLTAGINNVAYINHPEWAQIDSSGAYSGRCKSPLDPGYFKLCFNTPYLDYLCSMIQETIKMFPDGDGIFLDIINQGECCCPRCMAGMLKQGFDPTKSEDRQSFARQVLLKYYHRTADAVWSIDSKMPLFHNASNLIAGDTEILKSFSHLELESLPTGGWGYDHFPLSIAYARNLDMEVLGMTGKFHASWGDFGGFKHLNALRYECAAMIANGSKCSIGDQLHPSAELDESTYKLIGGAYREVQVKEPFCIGAKPVINIAVLSPAACLHVANGDTEIGVSRVLLEEHIFFDVIDQAMDFAKYRFLILPDSVPMTQELASKVRKFVANGGKVISSGSSILLDGKPILGINASITGESPYSPDYIKVAPDFVSDSLTTPFVMHRRSHRLELNPEAKSLGDVFDPYFNRAFNHFSSHQQTPYQMTPSGFSAGVITDSLLYFAHQVFCDYRDYGAVNVRRFIANAIRAFVGDEMILECGLPSTGRATVMEQSRQKRYIVHALFAPTTLRGGHWFDDGNNNWKQQHYEVIEDLPQIQDIPFSLSVPKTIKRVTLEPQGEEIPFAYHQNRCDFVLPKLECHQMIALHYE